MSKKGANLRDKGVNLSDFVENGIVFIMARTERARRACGTRNPTPAGK